MGAFAAHDRPGPGGPAVNGEIELGDLRAAAWFAIGVDRRPPGVVADGGDGGVQGVGNTGGDRELAVAGDEPVDERADRAGGVGTHQDRMHDRVRIVTRQVTASLLGGQLGDGHVDDGELVGAGVRRCVARPEHPGECFAAGVEEAEHRVEPEPTLEVRCRSLLAFGVDLDQRRVDIQHDLARVSPRQPTPWLGPAPAPPATRRARCRRSGRRPARSSAQRRPRRTRRADHATPPCPPHTGHQRRASPPPDRAADRGRDRRRVPRSTGPPPNKPDVRPTRSASSPNRWVPACETV